MAAVVETNLTGTFLCTQDAFRLMKRPDAARRADHQQRLALGLGAAPALGALHGDEARDHRAHASTSLDGRAYDIACGQIDIGNAATDMTEPMRTDWACSRPTARRRSSRRSTPADVARAVVYMATLPLDANVQFMTVMATKMPFVGRG